MWEDFWSPINFQIEFGDHLWTFQTKNGTRDTSKATRVSEEAKNNYPANDNLIRESNDDSSNIVEKIIKSSKKPKDIPVEWVRVQIKETTEVNGVRFPSGIQIDVTDEDAKQMIEGNQAILLEEVEKKEDEKQEGE